MTQIQLIAGLGNPGARYERTRHNAGADFVYALARQQAAELKPQTRFHGLTGQVTLVDKRVRLLVPLTYVNDSGIAIQAMLHYYRLSIGALLVVADEMDVPVGEVRLKYGGGSGGHRGVSSIITVLGGAQDFWRVRIGVGHPRDQAEGQPVDVTGYLLQRAPQDEQQCTDASSMAVLEQIRELIAGNWEQAMNSLHGRCFTGGSTLR